MHVGLSLNFQNLGDAQSDSAVYEHELALARQAESLGFESIWTTEHHFTDYMLSPNPLQFLTYIAGVTTDVELGTMAVILPWHDPVRVAEETAVLDQISGGRAVLGIGRGLGRVEFEGFRVPMGESRSRFEEAAELVVRALETGSLEHDGEHFSIPERDLRPGPLRSFAGRTYSAAVSPESVDFAAKLGLGMLIIAQKPWETVAEDLKHYEARFREQHGDVPPPPTAAAAYVFCDEDEERAREMAHRYIGRYYHSVIRHYELGGEQFASTAGYDYYAKMAGNINSRGEDETAQFFVDLQVWGTPEQCLEKVRRLTGTVNAGRFMATFNYAGMPFEDAERSMKLFASDVLPHLKGDGAELASAGEASGTAR